jgi:hypothetical protein
VNLHDARGVLAHDAPIFDAPWRDLDDDALLAHLCSARGVQVELVVDDDECTPEKIDGVMHGRFTFNGETHLLAEPIDWLANPSADVEWHILLHKFYYAAGLARAYRHTRDARYAQRWAALVDGWMRVTPPGFIAADVTGRRVQNWLYGLLALLQDGAPLDAAFVRRLLASLHEQVEYLCAHLTPKRNHRTLELYAIFLAGVALPELRRAAAWRELALNETVANMRADLLGDGVHCELSTDYHHLALRNWLHVRTLAAAHGVAVPDEMDRLLERALEFSLHVHKPDGCVPSLSDGDVRGFLPLLAQGADLYRREDMRFVATRGAQGRAPEATLKTFAASGYSVLRSGWDAQAQYLVFDSGPLGEGNHGHFDCLSFELAAFGRSLVVDPARYTYSEAGDVNWRVHFRGTAAHNTVCVDGKHQTRYVPKPIREPSRHAHGSVRHKIAGPAPEAALLEAAQGDGLALLHGRCASHEYDAVHERVIAFVDGRFWIVSDWLRARTEHDYALHFQLGAPAQDRTVLATGDDGVRLDSPQLTIVQPPRAGVSAQLDAGWVSERYGSKHAAPGLRCRQRSADADFDSVLLPWCERPPQVTASDLPVRAEDGTPARALRIALGEGAGARVHLWFHARSHAAQRWTIGEHVFCGRWLHLVEDGATGPQRAISHAGARLTRRGAAVPLGVAHHEGGPT